MGALSVQFNSVTQSCLILCDPMDCSSVGFPVHHQLLGLAQTHVHQVSDTIQPSHYLSVSFPAFNLSLHQYFSNELLSIRWPKHWASDSVSILSVNIQDWFPLGLISLITLLSKGISGVFSSATAWKHRFFSAQFSVWSNSHIHTRLLEKNIALTSWTFVGKVMSLLFNMLSMFVIAFLQRNKHLLISWPFCISFS